MRGFYDSLNIKPTACPLDCTACVDACVRRNGGDSLGAAIKLIHKPEVKQGGVITCNQCGEPSCVEICPTGAITKSEIDGVVRIDQERCVGCGLCTLACPYGGVYYNADKGKAFKCDMCDGHPVCVDACKYGVLSFVKSSPVYSHLHDEDLLSEGVAFCGGCIMELAIRFTLRVLGKDIVLFATASCSAPVLIGTGAVSLERTAFYACLMTNVASSATGFTRYYRKIGKDITAVCFVGDGCTSDVGFQPLSGAAERGENFIYICYDNEGYMNTGYQRSGTTPLGAWTSTTQVGVRERGKGGPAKNVPLLMAMHGVPYAATATLSHLEDYAQKLVKAKEAKKDGLAYIHLFSPCPTGWRMSPDAGIEVCRMAVESNYFPLWEAERGEFRLTYQPREPKPIKELTKLVGKFSHLNDDELGQLQKEVNSSFSLIQRLAGSAPRSKGS